MRSVVVTSCGLLVAMTLEGLARADDLPPLTPAPPPLASPPPPAPTSVRRQSPRLRGIATAATIDGSWVLALHINSALSSRAWNSPYPWGTIGHYSARILYGSSWTLTVTLEALAFVAAHGGGLDWLGEASYRSDWIVPVDAPSCSYVGASGGCGLGVGGFSFLRARPVRSSWWYEVGGGWIQQRVTNDAFRTVAESSWVLTPVSVVRELRTDLDAPVAVRLFAGPGLYLGMHAGHMHPTDRGRDLYRDAPLTQLYPLAFGAGPGARIEGRLVLGRHLSIEGEVTVAPLLLGGQPEVRRDVEPLHEDRGGIPVWRKVTFGVGWEDERTLPFKPTLAFFGAELSGRSVDRIGYRGVMLRFDIPLPVVRSR